MPILTFRLLLFLVAAVLAGCTALNLPKEMSVNDKALDPFKEAMAKVDTASLGFEPFPSTGTLRLELPKQTGGAYDAMLHVGRSTIAFRKVENGYRWMMQQECHEGPRLQETPDGPQHESLVIDHVTTTGWSIPLNQTVIRYWGDDPRLRDKTLTIEDVRPILQEWDRAGRAR